MNILSPNKVIASLEENVIFNFRDLHPYLSIIIKKDASPDEQSYLKSLQHQGEIYGTHVEVAEVNDVIEASKAIKVFKSSAATDGIIVLSDFGEGTQELYDLIPTRLDLDGVSTLSQGKLFGSKDILAYTKAPCPAVASYKLMQYEDIVLQGMSVAVIGRSLRVGRPTAEIFLQKDCAVTLFHSKTTIEYLDGYDIVISGAGKAKFITPELWQTPTLGRTKYIIDIGINFDEDGKLCGDVDIDKFESYDVNITPVPGGIGKLATTCLMTKLYANAATMSGRLNV